MGIIYVLHNEENDKCYVGQTTRTFEERFGAHKIFSSLIGKALRKYGVDNFSKIILENIPEEELDYWEIHYIQECNSLYPNGYNLDTGGNKNKHASDETRKIMSEIRKGEGNSFWGKHHTEEANRKNSEAHKGKKMPARSEEYKKHLSEANKGKIRTEEANRKNSEAHKGNTNMLGKHHTEEAKKKISKSLLGNVPWNKGIKINKMIASGEI